MIDTDVEEAKKIIGKILYITIATVSSDGLPWNSPVYSAYDESYNFYWVSWRENNHSKNIRENDNVFLVIYDSTVPAGTGKGVYIKAKAQELFEDHEINKAIVYLYGREKRKPHSSKEFVGDYPRRIYKATPEKFWINTDGKIQGNYIDKRVEIDLP